jgi:hypothetical protein
MRDKSGMQFRRDTDSGGTDRAGALRRSDDAHVLVTDHRVRGFFRLTCLGEDLFA